MEDSQCTDLEIELFRRLKEEFPANVGLVFQSYLKRPLDDIKGLQDLNSNHIPINYRLCKGIYVEPEEIAYKNNNEINEHFLKDLEYMFENKKSIRLMNKNSTKLLNYNQYQQQIPSQLQSIHLETLQRGWHF